MARKTKADKPSTAPKKTAEDLSDEQLQKLFFDHKHLYEARLAAKKKADADLKNACKLIKSEGTKIADIKMAIDLETDEGEARIKADLQSTLRVARWMGASIGQQFEMFDADRTPASERARGEGKRAGMKAEARKPPYDPSTEQYREWMAGYDEGQAVNADGFRKPEGKKWGSPGEVAAAGDDHIRRVSEEMGKAKPTLVVQ